MAYSNHGETSLIIVRFWKLLPKIHITLVGSSQTIDQSDKEG